MTNRQVANETKGAISRRPHPHATITTSLFFFIISILLACAVLVHACGTMRGFLLMVLLASAAGYLFLSTASRSAWLCCAGAGLIVVANLVHLLRGDADLGARAARRRLETQLANGGGEAKHLFAGKVFWVVGASSGIGAATAKVAAACGAKLILSARREAKLRKVAAECERAGAADVSVVPLDVTEFASHKAVVERVLKQANQIDILVRLLLSFWLLCRPSQCIGCVLGAGPVQQCWPEPTHAC